MEIKITEQKEHPMLERMEVIGIATYENATPSRAELRKKISEQLKINEEVVVLNKITPVFGRKESKISAHVYKKKEDVQKYESKTNIQRAEGKKKEGEESEETPKAEEKESVKEKKEEKEKPKEEKEEKKPEEKPKEDKEKK